MTRCSKCLLPATYDTPARLCSWHWHLWWNEKLPWGLRHAQALVDWVYVTYERRKR